MNKYIFSSSPILNLAVGIYQFENGLLTFTDEREAAKFRTLHESLPIPERQKIVEIDISRAERIVDEHRSLIGGATKEFDSSADTKGIEALKTRMGGVLGTSALEAAADAQRIDNGEKIGEIRPAGQPSPAEVAALTNNQTTLGINGGTTGDTQLGGGVVSGPNPTSNPEGPAEIVNGQVTTTGTDSTGNTDGGDSTATNVSADDRMNASNHGDPAATVAKTAADQGGLAGLLNKK